MVDIDASRAARHEHSRTIRTCLRSCALGFAMLAVWARVSLPAPLFGASMSYATNPWPGNSIAYWVAIGDLSRDGRPDLVVANGEAQMSVLPGRGDGTFPDYNAFPAGGYAQCVAIGNLVGGRFPSLAVGYVGPTTTIALMGYGYSSVVPDSLRNLLWPPTPAALLPKR